MSTKRKRALLSIKDKHIIISRLDNGEKRTNLAQEFDISEQQISDTRKNKDKILKFTDSIVTSEGLRQKSLKLTDDEQLDKALCSPGLFNRDLLEHRFQVRFPHRRSVV